MLFYEYIFFNFTFVQFYMFTNFVLALSVIVRIFNYIYVYFYRFKDIDFPFIVPAFNEPSVSRTSYLQLLKKEMKGICFNV